MPTAISPEPDNILSVYTARDFVASDGTDLGDPLGRAEDLIAGDAYQLSISVRRAGLALTTCENGSFVIAPSTEVGRFGAAVILNSCVTFMSPDGGVVDILRLAELSVDGTVCDIHIHPLAKMSALIAYAIVAIDQEDALIRFAETACVSYTRSSPHNDGTARNGRSRGCPSATAS